MAREGLMIDTGQVQATATQIDTQNTELYTTLRRIEALMRSTNEQWQSPAAEAIREDFSQAASKFFESYRVILEDYTKFLRVTVVDSFSHLDEQLKQNASRFSKA